MHINKKNAFGLSVFNSVNDTNRWNDVKITKYKVHSWY
jgi:hypothetical protein